MSWREYHKLRYFELATHLFRTSEEFAWPKQRELTIERGWSDLRRLVVVNTAPDGCGSQLTLLQPDKTLAETWVWPDKVLSNRRTFEGYAAWWEGAALDLRDAVLWLGYALREVWRDTYHLRHEPRRDWTLVRECLRAEGVEPNDAAMAEVIHEQEGPFGVLLTRDRRLFTYQVALATQGDIAEMFAHSELTEWVERPPDDRYWEDTAYHAQWYLEIEDGRAPEWPLHGGLPAEGEPHGVTPPGVGE